MIFVRFAAENLQVFGDGGFDFGVAGQGAAIVHAKPVGGFLFGESIIADTVINDDARGLLRYDSSFAF